MVKPATHDDVGTLIAYVQQVLMTGMYPDTQWNGSPWPKNSVEAGRAGKPFAGGWRAYFAAFKSDLEARALVHKMVRYWNSNSICEHCLASKLPQLSYGDFTDGAAYMQYMLSHDEFLELNARANNGIRNITSLSGPVGVRRFGALQAGQEPSQLPLKGRVKFIVTKDPEPQP